MKSCQ